jgi:hypothetical protein
MWTKYGKSFLTMAFIASSLASFSVTNAFANHHHELNGTWQLVPARSELHGQPAIQTGTVNINDREGNVWVERNFSLESENATESTSFATDSRVKASIKEPGFKSKAKWEGDMLKVTTTHEGVTTVERYSLLGDGTMMLQVDRTGRPSETLYFQHQ